MNDTLYIIVNRNGVEKTAKTGRFQLDPGERAFRLDIEIPEEAFDEPPCPTVSIHIPAKALTTEIEIKVGGGSV